MRGHTQFEAGASSYRSSCSFDNQLCLSRRNFERSSSEYACKVHGNRNASGGAFATRSINSATVILVGGDGGGSGVLSAAAFVSLVLSSRMDRFGEQQLKTIAAINIDRHEMTFIYRLPFFFAAVAGRRDSDAIISSQRSPDWIMIPLSISSLALSNSFFRSGS